MRIAAPRLPQRLPRRLAPALLGGLLFVAAFWLGLRVHFPGAAASKLVEARLNRVPGVSVALSPLQLGWGGVRAESLQVRDAPDGRPALALRNLYVPFSWRLLRGIPVEAEVGLSGSLALTWSWAGELRLRALDARLEDFPAPPTTPPVSLRGRLHAEGRIGASAPGPLAAVPEGELSGHAEGLEISQAQLAGVNLPPIRLESLDFALRLGPTVQVERMAFQGDLQGTLTGTILPVLGRPLESRLTLNLATEVRQSWLNQLGDFRSLAQGVLQGGRLNAGVGGTLGNPTLVRNPGRP